MLNRKIAIISLALTACAPTALMAQNSSTGVATETEERRIEGQDQQIPWDYLGLLGLIGLAGLRKRRGTVADRD